ncbi:MAG: hypothetical protein E7320_00560 [Clostridiales bacterium]|nr:hypothetical protein [Clostridiales bacterium]
MTKSVNKRLLILLAAFVLVLGGMWALRGTFASQVNYNGPEEKLIGSRYAVELQYWNGSDYVSLLGDNAQQPFTDGSAMCPGRSEIAYLRVTNNEKFPIDTILSLDVTASGFDSTISYAVLEGDWVNNPNQPASWSEFATKANGSKVLSVAKHELLKLEPLAAGETRWLAVCIHMDESATSAYQNKRMEMKFDLRMNANYKPDEDPANN